MKDPLIKSNEEDAQYHLLYLPRGVQRLQKLGKPVHYCTGTKLNVVGEKPEYCYIVLSGRILCYEISYGGDLRVYNIMEPGSLFLEDCLLFDKPCPIQFETFEDCDLVRIEKCDLKRAFKHDIDIVMDVCESLSTKFMAAMDYMRLGPRQTANWKICRMLLTSAQHYGELQSDGSCLLRRKVSHQMFADILGLNRVTVTRKFKELKELGLFDTVNGYMVLKSIQALENYMVSIEIQED